MRRDDSAARNREEVQSWLKRAGRITDVYLDGVTLRPTGGGQGIWAVMSIEDKHGRFHGFHICGKPMTAYFDQVWDTPALPNRHIFPDGDTNIFESEGVPERVAAAVDALSLTANWRDGICEDEKHVFVEYPERPRRIGCIKCRNRRSLISWCGHQVTRSPPTPSRLAVMYPDQVEEWGLEELIELENHQPGRRSLKRNEHQYARNLPQNVFEDPKRQYNEYLLQQQLV